MGLLSVQPPTGANAEWVAEVEKPLKATEDLAVIYATKDALESTIPGLQEQISKLHACPVTGGNEYAEWDAPEHDGLEGKQDTMQSTMDHSDKWKEGSGGGKKSSLTTKRNFMNMPEYSGKHDDFDDWNCKMSTFHSEETEFKELLLLLEKEELSEPSRAEEIMDETEQILITQHKYTEIDRK